MKDDSSKTNYLASAKSSEYDSLQRQIAALTHHWMDHSAQVKPSKVIPLLCDYIDNTEFEFLKCDEQNLFSTKSDYYLGKIIAYVIEIQDEKGESLKDKRKEIETILTQFFLLLHRNKPNDQVNLGKINKSSQLDNVHNAGADNKDKDIKWWLKFLDFFGRSRK